jgi:hypothetical protein
MLVFDIPSKDMLDGSGIESFPLILNCSSFLKTFKDDLLKLSNLKRM